MNAEAKSNIIEPTELLKLLPHRFPFLLVDRIIEVNADESCIGIKNVTFNEPFFPGHFPNRPVMPGVLLIEGMAQTAGALCSRSIGPGGAPPNLFCLTVDKAKFRKPVLPGDTVEYHMKQIRKRRTMWWFHGDARVGGVTVCEAEVGAMIVED
ncbi:MAG: 3-hydroxyacyl-ACP dehydratase FabZ [Rhizobiales bacterium]|nr:3-hydroxyacyl-ACP dehydratase FabZ [Hyphomicrobiales bacterium]